MNRPRPLEVAIPALTFTVAGWLIGGTLLGAVGGAVFGIALGSVASVAGHDGVADGEMETREVTDEQSG